MRRGCSRNSASAEAAEEYAINYSTGMKKKLGLACALIHDPPVLILDEPTNGLDPRAAREVQDRLRAAARGKTIFLSTHLLDMAETVCSRVGIIHHGELVAEGTLNELRARIGPGGSLEEVFLKVTTQGAKFKRFYVTDPLCCPSRATFLTGQYAHNTGVISNGGPNALAALQESDTLGVWLQQAGYRTAFVGKYLNDYGLDDPERVPPGWTEWRALLEPTTQNYFDYDVNEDGAVTHYGTAPEDYKTRVLGHLAVDAIRHAARGTRPLFLYVGFNAPHAPSTPAPRDAGSLEGTTAPRTPGLRRGRPLRQAELPPRPPAAGRTRSPASTPATSARSSRWPRSIARWRRSSTRCVKSRSWATPTSPSPPTTAISTESTGSSSASCSPTSPRARCRC